MEKNRSTKIIAIVALVVAVVGLSLGFASYSELLDIAPEAIVTPDASTFNVKFSTVSDSITSGTVEANGNGENATLNGTTISGLKANFSAPGDEVTYDFYVRNNGEYDAYLTAVTFGTITISEEEGDQLVEKEVLKNCVAVPGTADNQEEADENLVKAACDDINVSITVGTDTNTKDLIASKANLTNHVLKKSDFETVSVKIAYDDNDNRADGDFTVAFGDITLSYSSVDNNAN